tara:strand:+ start:1404 stop:1835 length:432 start_codon:yes stop_codon:yes gene_type:complete
MRLTPKLKQEIKDLLERNKRESRNLKPDGYKKGVVRPDFRAVSGLQLAPMMAFKMVLNNLEELLKSIEYEYKHHPNTHYTVFDIKQALYKEIDMNNTPMYNRTGIQRDWWFLIYETVQCNIEHYSAYYAPSLHEHLEAIGEFE